MKGAYTVMAQRDHPKKGSSIKVDPIKDPKDIKTLKDLLRDKPRDYCLFILGINTALRASDLLRIKVKHVRNLKPMDDLELKEKKTKKYRRLTLNAACIDAITKLLASATFHDDDFLFRSQRPHIKSPEKQVLTVSSVNRLVKDWCSRINLKGNFGAHTLRKTFGYHQRVRFNTPIPELMHLLNHASQRQTLEYLCIQPEEIRDVYANEI
jgi:integrase